MNVNNNSAKLQYLMDVHGRGGAIHYAVMHHTPTKTSWTDEEFDTALRKFENWASHEAGIWKNNLDEFLDFRKESFRRGLEHARKSNQFNFVINDFNPHFIGDGSIQTNSHNRNVFQDLAGILEQQKAGIHSLHENFNGRFMSEEDFELRLMILHQQFNEAIQSIADIFRGYINHLNNSGRQTALSANQAEAIILQVGDMVRDHIWSGGSADDVNGIINSSSIAGSVNQLHRIGDDWFRGFQ